MGGGVIAASGPHGGMFPMNHYESARKDHPYGRIGGPGVGDNAPFKPEVPRRTTGAGEDLNGVAFKLSDYRGKVVVLDFWGDW